MSDGHKVEKYRIVTVSETFRIRTISEEDKKKYRPHTDGCTLELIDEGGDRINFFKNEDDIRAFFLDEHLYPDIKFEDRVVPAPKAEGMERDLENLFGHDRREPIAAGRCAPEPVGCGKPVNPNVDKNDASAFRDEVSLHEYSISGLCQNCQDIAFAPPPEDDHDHCSDDHAF